MVGSVQVDIKRLIALSSVAHLNLALAGALCGSLLGLSSFVLLSILHGVVSSGMFYAAGLMSKSSRLMYLLNGVVVSGWLLLLSFNLGLPPSPSFWSEIMSYMSLMGFSVMSGLVLLVGGMFMAWLSILVYLLVKVQAVVSVNVQSLTLMLVFIFVLVFNVSPLIWL